MELSEMNELHRVLNSGYIPTKKSVVVKSPKGMIDYNMKLHDELRSSPPCVVPKEINTSFHDDVPPTTATINEKNKESPKIELQVEKINDFKESYYESISKVSSLTQSIIDDANNPRDRRRSSDKQGNVLDLKIYLFATHDTIDVSVSIAATVEQLISRIISLYSRSEISKVMPLPKGQAVEAYSIYLLDEDTNFPDTDFIIDGSKVVRDLDTKKLAFCANFGGSYSKQVHLVNSFSSVKGYPIKIYYEDTWAAVGVDPRCEIKDILTEIETVNPKLGYMNPSEYEFRIEVAVEDDIEKEECIVNMDLPISSLTTNELKLYKKVYKDTPAETFSMKKSIMARNENYDTVHNPSRFHISRAQACAYKEYEVIHVNKKNKKQKRILGINQLRIFNMTVAQSKKAVKERVGAEEKGVFSKKIASIFKKTSKRPEILIASIQNVQLDTNNPSNFFINYTENSMGKLKVFETEKPLVAIEIVAKISKLMTLVSS